MRFWDTSAIIPLMVEEASTLRMQALIRQDPAIAVWWGTPVECASALARLEREGTLESQEVIEALGRLGAMGRAWLEIDASDIVRETAIRFLRVHSLRAADALQLAAAFVAAENRPASLRFVTLDDRLRAAADKEGFATPAG